jgi:hypothetical protein
MELCRLHVSNQYSSTMYTCKHLVSSFIVEGDRKSWSLHCVESTVRSFVLYHIRIEITAPMHSLRVVLIATILHRHVRSNPTIESDGTCSASSCGTQ